MHRTQPIQARPGDRGFTLVEVLIVVVILGVLAAMVVPSFTSATDGARESTLREDVRFMRNQIVMYRADHNGAPPGYPNNNLSGAPNEATFIAHLTSYSNSQGQTSDTPDAAHPFGPYLRRIPVNPINGEDTVLVIANGAALPAAADDSTGWVYKPQTGEFLSNAAGNDTAGEPYYDY